MTDQDLAVIETRASLAAEGPWELRCETPSGLIWSVRHKEYLDGTPGNLIMSGRRAECQFICAARQDVPALVAEVRRLREDLRATQWLVRQAEERANAEWARNAYRQMLEAREAGRGEGE